MSIKVIDGKTALDGAKIGIVVSRWNSSITEKMLQGANTERERTSFWHK